MAEINLIGIEDIENKLIGRANDLPGTMHKMLNVGAKILIQAQKREIAAFGLIDSGDLQNSIKDGGVKSDGTCSYIEIYPRGKDHKGVRNATKGAIAEYGKSNQPRKEWKRSANTKAEGDVSRAMGEVWKAAHND